MIDHIGITVRDLAASKAFFAAALAPLGVRVVMEFPDAVGMGPPGKPGFWLGAGGTPSGPVHLAFAAPDRRAVDAFHRSAIAAGGKDNGAPGIRAHYHPDYYGAFVIAPDGHNVEAVCHRPDAV
jgi:catechol 2,3-dioxygenase-like lactoylglutathione lyase family enzyme